MAISSAHQECAIACRGYDFGARIGKARTRCSRGTGTKPSFLLHPLDLLGGDQVPALSFFPGMDLSGAKKTELFEKVLKELAQHFTLVNMSTHALSLCQKSEMKAVAL